MLELLVGLSCVIASACALCFVLVLGTYVADPGGLRGHIFFLLLF